MMLLKNTLTNVTCETLYRLHTPRPTWFGALKKKCSSKPPAATEELACKAFAGEKKEKAFLHAFLPPGTHLLCALPNKGISQFRRGRRGSGVATGLRRAGFPPQNVKYKQTAKAKLGFSAILEETPRHSVLAIKTSITKPQRTWDSFSFYLA